MGESLITSYSEAISVVDGSASQGTVQSASRDIGSNLIQLHLEVQADSDGSEHVHVSLQFTASEQGKLISPDLSCSQSGFMCLPSI